MIGGQRLGLDELMIVNPDLPGSGTFFLGEDGILYQVQGWAQKKEERRRGQFFLGGDGTLYQLRGSALDENEGHELGRFFLGEDGTLYEVIR